MKCLQSKQLLKRYSQDKSIFHITPSCVAFPRNEQEVGEILSAAREYKMGVTARGGGTGLSGAAIGTGIILDFTKHMNKILTVGKITRVQSGVLLKDVRGKIHRKGFMLPGVPLHGECALGGNVNTRSVGPRSLKYGSIDKRIKYIRGVLGDGRILDTRKSIPQDLAQKIKKLQQALKKNKRLVTHIKNRPVVAGGYNVRAFLEHSKIQDLLAHLIVGSVGTLLLVTEIGLLLPKKKETKELYLIYCDTLDEVQKVLNTVIKKGAVAIEYIGESVLKRWGNYYSNCHGAVLVGFEKKVKLKGVKIPSKEYSRIWKIRQDALPKLRQSLQRQGYSAPSITDDVTFHPKDFSKVMNDIDAYFKKRKIPYAAYGHIGFGSMHIRPFIKRENLQALALGIYKIVKKYKGTLCGEHNAGISRSKYLALESAQLYRFMKKIKHAFDPENILNPHVMFNLPRFTKYLKT